MPSLQDVVAVVEARYDPATAESWDAVGLTCGEPAAEVRRVLLAVDPVPEVVDEAERGGADLLITHHPLLFSPVHSVAATSAKGALVHRMIRSGIAHLAVHTNADVARPGVSDALADRLGVVDTVALEPLDDVALDKLVVFVPVERAEAVIEAVAAAGAGRIGAYDRAAFLVDGTGTFRPGPGARPAIGRIGDIERVAETRVEMVLAPARRAAVLEALLAVHPYEQPAFDVTALRPTSSGRGTGRVGRVAEAMSLRAFTDLVAARLPAAPAGIRAAGDPDRSVRRVAVCGGAGAPFSDAARFAGADVYVTGDLKHHSTSEAVTEHGEPAMALIDAGHWATEAPWLPVLAGQLRAELGTTVDVAVSARVTDPWRLHAPSTAPA